MERTDLFNFCLFEWTRWIEKEWHCRFRKEMVEEKEKEISEVKKL